MKLKKGTIFLFFFTICQLCICQNKLLSKDGFIFPDSESFEGRKPEVNWVWDSGDPNPKNYYLHFRKSFTLSSSIKDVKCGFTQFFFVFFNIFYISCTSLCETYKKTCVRTR